MDPQASRAVLKYILQSGPVRNTVKLMVVQLSMGLSIYTCMKSNNPTNS